MTMRTRKVGGPRKKKGYAQTYKPLAVGSIGKTWSGKDKATMQNARNLKQIARHAAGKTKPGVVTAKPPKSGGTLKPRPSGGLRGPGAFKPRPIPRPGGKQGGGGGPKRRRRP